MVHQIIRLAKRRCSEIESLDAVTPHRAAFGIEPAGFKSPFDSSIAWMNFSANAPDASLLGVVEESGDEAATNTLASPLWCDEQGDDIHRLARKFRAPFVRSVGVTAQCPFVVLSDDDKPAVAGVHDVFKYAAGIFGGSLCSDVR